LHHIHFTVCCVGCHS